MAFHVEGGLLPGMLAELPGMLAGLPGMLAGLPGMPAAAYAAAGLVL